MKGGGSGWMEERVDEKEVEKRRRSRLKKEVEKRRRSRGEDGGQEEVSRQEVSIISWSIRDLDTRTGFVQALRRQISVNTPVSPARRQWIRKEVILVNCSDVTSPDCHSNLSYSPCVFFFFFIFKFLKS